MAGPSSGKKPFDTELDHWQAMRRLSTSACTNSLRFHSSSADHLLRIAMYVPKSVASAASSPSLSSSSSLLLPASWLLFLKHQQSPTIRRIRMPAIAQNCQCRKAAKSRALQVARFCLWIIWSSFCSSRSVSSISISKRWCMHSRVGSSSSSLTMSTFANTLRRTQTKRKSRIESYPQGPSSPRPDCTPGHLEVKLYIQEHCPVASGIPTRLGTSPFPGGSLFHCLTNLSVKNIFLLPNLNVP
ncbi:uncharacterized protein LOC115606726 [Strigops habroptila]|uniref:uncharacterized protein LOC115606726 n=1 Tax=Strigops habroptila TaxID=2489341 RepID=UPI0011CF7651|nr:uncharacterized protein LOC115606726 [Strigops habroptila]